MRFDVEIKVEDRLDLLCDSADNVLTGSLAFQNFIKGEKGDKGDAVFFTTRIDENGDLIITQSDYMTTDFELRNKNLIIKL